MPASAGSGGGTTTTSSPSPPPAYTPKTPLERYFAGVLGLIKAPVTQANVDWLVSWAAKEGTAARNNPLATTLRTNGSTPLPGNSAGVQEYPTAAAGVAATAATLKGYSSIVSAFQTGNILGVSFNNPPGLIADFTTWSGNRDHPAAGLAYYQSIKANAGGSGAATEGNLGDELTGLGALGATALGGKGAGAAAAIGVGSVTGATISDEIKAAGGFAGGIVSGVLDWLSVEGRLVLAYVVLVAMAGALFVTGLKGLGAPMPKLPRTVPLPVPA